MTRTRTTHALSALAAVATLTISGMALAQDAGFDTGRSATVRYGDLTLSSPDGRARAMQRIDLAADEVCSEAADDPQLSRQALYRQCKAQAVKTGVQQLNAIEAGQLARANGEVQTARR